MSGQRSGVMRPKPTEISKMLAANIRSLVVDLLPGGHRDGNEWVHPSLTGTSRRSLSIRLSGSKAGVWADFASGEAGDALDLVATVSFGGNMGDALAWSRSWLGIGDEPAPAPRRLVQPVQHSAEGMDAEAEVMRGAALRLFLAGKPSIGGTPAAEYLAGRGIDLAELGRQPRSLRYHPAVRNKESDRAWPALLAAISDAKGEMVAVHRTWLSRREDGRWTKAPLSNAKMSLGQVRGGTIRLWRGKSGMPLARAPAGDQVAIGEGIETCLSVVVACPELRVLSCVPLANMANIELPPSVSTVTLLKDDDGENAAARKAFGRAVDRYLREGRTVRIAEPPVGNDFNDTLQADTLA